MHASDSISPLTCLPAGKSLTFQARAKARRKIVEL